MNIHYRPYSGCTADIIPFYWDGEYHLFYLKGNDDLYTRFDSSWEHIVSKDLLSWTNLPQVIYPNQNVPGSPDYQACWTGCVFHHEETFHIFYCGLNKGKQNYQQTICHATSTDLMTWTKDEANPLLIADDKWYEPNDWRDPFVFYNKDEQKFWMLITSRIKEGPSDRRACIGLAVSDDLVSWEIRPPLFTPYTGYSFECMDLFEHGKGMYLLYSTYIDNYITQYRYSETGFSGFRLTSYEDAIDSSRFYAAKTLFDGTRRIAFGWVPDRRDASDDNEWLWGGNLALPHVLTPTGNGKISVSYPGEFKKIYGENKPIRMIRKFGSKQHDIVKKIHDSIDLPSFNENETILDSWSTQEQSTHLKSNGFECCLSEKSILQPFYLSVKIISFGFYNYVGLLFDADEELNHYYCLRIEPRFHRIGIYRYPDRQKLAVRPFHHDGDIIKLELFYCDNILEVFVDDRIAITTRTYPKVKGHLGFFVEDGSAQFSELEFKEKMI